ncbi:Uncharacterized protein FWK35_00018194 [Aphis craccivora]|uniref:Uncharacterized protein n=1 Tax=Aphis craccivora TaxID=307492 RepID=A0A6G0Y7J2_APHCR|nr:Uncharacterized protein FWK35_00018194 [Aphis craccivora]
MFTTPKQKSVIVIAQKLFFSGKRYNPIKINNTPKADLNELIKKSKNMWDTDGYTQKENDYKKCLALPINNPDYTFVLELFKRCSSKSFSELLFLVKTKLDFFPKIYHLRI